MILPGEDVEYCEVVQLPGDPGEQIYVIRFEAAMTDFSHHLIVSAVIPGSATDEATSPGDKIPCTGAGDLGDDLLPVTGSQQPYNQEEFPAGIGRVYEGGSKLIIDYHYFNTSSEEVQARAKVNFYQTTEDEVERIAWPFGMINLGFEVPPAATETTVAECMFNEDAYVYKLTRHTHRWGRNFDVWFAGGERDGEHIFNSGHFEDVDHRFDEPIFVKAGEGFRFACEFVNTEDYALKFGLKATDEMCILFGTWWVENVGDPYVEQGCFSTGDE